MGDQSRIKKTLAHKLSDFDEHLFLLRESLNRINEREAHLKILAAELRVLVCLSSGTEGLLWRLIDEFGLSDEVYVHYLGRVNTGHPMARGLVLALIPPILRGGEGDPEIPPSHQSLKRMLKEGDAVFVMGKGLSHEYLIKAIAQQMGSAHEDEGLEPALDELQHIFVNGLNPYIPTLKADADLILELGERVLDEAEKRGLYTRKH